MSARPAADRAVLVVDDEPSVAASLAALLRSNGLANVIECTDSRQVMDLVGSRDVGVVLLDLTMPHRTGGEVLADLHQRYPDTAVIVVTGTNEVPAAVECMKAGAFDYLVKAVEESRLVSSVRRALEIGRLRREFGNLKDRLLAPSLRDPDAFSAMQTRSPAMRAVFLLIESIARSSEPILVTGETGVGKKLVAEAIHRVSGRTGELVDVNVAGLDDLMFADTLFGHRKGAFTGAEVQRAGMIQQAAGGTLLMNEIGDLSPASQVKLLQLLDTTTYYPLGSDLPRRCEARIVVATNRDLAKSIEEGDFRRDLFFRLSTHAVRVPPLRERKEDLPLLVGLFVAEAAEKLQREPPRVPAELFSLLEAYHFPGNVRELRSMVYDAIARTASGTLSLDPFRDVIRRDTVLGGKNNAGGLRLVFSERLPTIREAMGLLIEEALNRAGGNQSVAAGLLGISHQALSKRMQRTRGASPASR
ncbi:MAG: two-component system response regulator [Spirochaetes bacterium RBG_13_68_11]|nr:MAG: two-component system response regulator [Spirochaetes bacterium RBG_13_68_11]